MTARDETTSLALDLTARLSPDPVEATAQIMTTAAIVAVSAGLDDASAVRALSSALDVLRESGIGEARN